MGQGTQPASAGRGGKIVGIPEAGSGKPDIMTRAVGKATKGLRREDFVKTCANGFGDRENSFPHSMAWFKGALYVGTTRSNMAMLRFAMQGRLDDFEIWPVKTPETREGLNQLDRRAQIWRFTPQDNRWMLVYKSPVVDGVDYTETDRERTKALLDESNTVAREIGYRGMLVYKSRNDPEPALYVSTFAPRNSPGVLILRTYNGMTYEQVSDFGVIGKHINSIRSMIEFRGKLYIAPTGSRGAGNMNISEANIYVTDNPQSRKWEGVTEQGLGNKNNMSIFSMCATKNYLYAGTFNNNGYEVYRSDCNGVRPYRWERVISGGAGRGAENQIALSMTEYKGYIYIGSGIQNGGHDRANNIGPAASQLVRYCEASSEIELVIGENWKKEGSSSLSGLGNGFDNELNGYFWRMCEHQGWLYLSTFDRGSMLEWIKLRRDEVRHELVRQIGLEHFLKKRGCELWRTWDGENWLPVTQNGFDNPYNFGIRTMQSTTAGLFVGVANPFGPEIAKRRGGKWVYEANEQGGLEIWLGGKIDMREAGRK